jgi:translation initiation factor 1
MSTRIVYSTGKGRICPGCGWPAVDCRCSRPGEQTEEVHKRVTAKLRLERQGRAGKSVTVIDGLPHNTEFLTELAGSLKKSCGTGGTVRPGAIELNGDVRERVRSLLAGRGFTVKG